MLLNIDAMKRVTLNDTRVDGTRVRHTRVDETREWHTSEHTHVPWRSNLDTFLKRTITKTRFPAQVEHRASAGSGRPLKENRTPVYREEGGGRLLLEAMCLFQPCVEGWGWILDSLILVFNTHISTFFPTTVTDKTEILVWVVFLSHG